MVSYDFIYTKFYILNFKFCFYFLRSLIILENQNTRYVLANFYPPFYLLSLPLYCDALLQHINSICHQFFFSSMQIALLSGNPGLGKTTLAHIVAKHAGYNPVEMNARLCISILLFNH